MSTTSSSSSRNPITWTIKTIGELCDEFEGDVQTGPFGSQLHASDYVNVGIPVVMPVNLVDAKLSSAGIAYISQDDQQRLSKYQLRAGDIVYARRGDIGRCALVTATEDGWLCGTGCLRIRFNNPAVDSRYVAFYLGLPKMKEFVLSRAVGTTLPNLNTGILRSIPIQLPPIKVQRRIAAILASIEDKIELNRSMNEALEKMAMALYKHWFVDSGPFHNGGFVESELGMIPQGWKVSTIDAEANIVMGQSPKSEYYNTEGQGLPFHQGVTYFGKRIPEHEVYCSQVLRIAEPENVLVSVRAPVGRINVADRKMVIGRGLASLSHKKGWNSYLLYFLKHVFFQEDRFGAGTIFSAITRKDLANIKAVVPREDVAERFNNLIKPYDDLILSNTIETRRLVELRNYLLPRLLSGEIELRDAEAVQ